MARILIVDDEPDMRLAVRNVLKLRGHEVVEAGDGPAALEILAGEDVDLMLLDIRLPGMDGIEVLEKAKAIKSSLPVVMITGYGHIQSAVNVMKLGASEYLQKPFENAQLVEMVRRFTERKPAPVPVPAATEPEAAELPEQERTFRVPVFAKAALLAAGLALVLFAGSALSDRYLSYLKIYPAASANISVLLWSGEDLWAGDWLSQSVYRYQKTKAGLELRKKYPLENVHISGFAVTGDRIYIADSWKKVIEERRLDEGLTLVRSFPFPGRVISLFYDGEYLWSCDAEGAVLLHKTDAELSVAAYFKLPNKPDQIYKNKDALWSAVSSTGKVYRHNLDDKLSIAGVYSIKMPSGGQTLSAFTWKGSRLWLAGDGSQEIYESGRSILRKAE